MAQVYGNIDAAAGATEPAFEYRNGANGYLFVTREQLEDYARRVFRVAVELTTVDP